MVVNIQNITFQYPAGSGTAPADPVLAIPAWTLSAGERLFLHGPSGSGKSTFLNLLSGILTPDTGSIEILGERLDLMSSAQRDKWRAHHVGVVFQQFNLIAHLSPIQNIQLANYFARSAKKNGDNKLSNNEALLTALGIDPSLHHKPAAALSLGQQQRVAIARAMINRPELLIVDEPTSSLDASNRDEFMDLLVKQVTSSNATLIFVSHDTSLTPYFTRIDALPAINCGRKE